MVYFVSLQCLIHPRDGHLAKCDKDKASWCSVMQKFANKPVCLLLLITDIYNLHKIEKKSNWHLFFRLHMIKAQQHFEHQMESLKRLGNEQVLLGHFGVDTFIMKHSERRAAGHPTKSSVCKQTEYTYYSHSVLSNQSFVCLSFIAVWGTDANRPHVSKCHMKQVEISNIESELWTNTEADMQHCTTVKWGFPWKRKMRWLQCNPF